MLVICTRRYDLVILKYTSKIVTYYVNRYEEGKIMTHAKVNYGEEYCQPVDVPIVAVHPEGTMIVICAYQGDVRVASLDAAGVLIGVKMMRIQVDMIHDMTFIRGEKDYELLILSSDFPRQQSPARHINSFQVIIEDEVLKQVAINESLPNSYTKLSINYKLLIFYSSIT